MRVGYLEKRNLRESVGKMDAEWVVSRKVEMKIDADQDTLVVIWTSVSGTIAARELIVVLHFDT